MRTIIVYLNKRDISHTQYEIEKTPLTNILHKLTVQSNAQKSFCVSGCDIDNKDFRDVRGMFTFNLESQVDNLVATIKQEIAQLDRHDSLTLNLYGEELGGAAALWICQKLKDIKNITINLCVFDPTTKNSIGTSYADNVLGFQWALSGRINDLRANNIKNALVLFTNGSPEAPILPMLPNNAKIDVMPGNKDTGFFSLFSDNRIGSNSDQCAILFHRVTQFLEKCNTKFDYKAFFFQQRLEPHNQDQIIRMLATENALIKQNEKESYTREMHFNNKIITKKGKFFLNSFHKELSMGDVNNFTHDCSLSVQDLSPMPNTLNGLQPNKQIPELAKKVGGVAALTTACCLFYAYPLFSAGVATFSTAAFTLKQYEKCRRNQQEEPKEKTRETYRM